MSKPHMSVVHAWAHQSGRDNQAKGFAMYYEGDTIYSYGPHFPIAKLITHETHGKAVLFTTNSYGQATAKHKSYTRRGIPHDYPVIEVDDPTGVTREHDYAYSLSTAKSMIEHAKSARTRGDWWLSRAQHWLDNANLLNIFFDLKHDRVTMETLGVNLADIEARVAEGKRKAEEAERERLRLRNIENAERRTQWLAGERIHFIGTDDDGRALLRINGQFLETSLGVVVPLREAIIVFKMMARSRVAGKDWPRDYYEDNVPFICPEVGDYKVDTIGKDGTLYAGCHVIGYEESERVAKLAGVTLSQIMSAID